MVVSELDRWCAILRTALPVLKTANDATIKINIPFITALDVGRYEMLYRLCEFINSIHSL
jgi:hypothetical protein